MLKYQTRRCLMYICLLTSLSSCFAVSANTHQKTLMVHGNGAVSAIPDAFSITVSLQERGPVVGKLHSAMTSRLDSIVAFLLAQGIAENNIQSMLINVYPWYENTPQERQQRGVVLSRQVQIKGQNIEKYDVILDGLLSRGVERIDRFEFVQSDEYALYNRSLVAAIDDAKAKANLMAKQLGLKITGVVNVAHQELGAPSMQTAMMARSDAFESSAPGTIDFMASVQVTFSVDAIK